jgi:hypothetical protein
MTTHIPVRSTFGSALALAVALGAGSIGWAQSPTPPLAINTSRITIAGTSNVHAYAASTTDARVTRARFAGAPAGAAFWDDLQGPGRLEAFDLSIAAGSLTSPKGDLEENMNKALKVKEHPEITFSLTRLDGGPGALTASGMLSIAGVARQVTFPLKTTRTGNNLTVTGALDLLMTDYGIAPPKAMLGMIKAGPGIKVTFEVLVVAPENS